MVSIVPTVHCTVCYVYRAGIGDFLLKKAIAATEFWSSTLNYLSMFWTLKDM